MTFTFQNKPDAPDLLSVSQVDLKNNAQYFQAALNKDHQIVFGDTNTTTFEGRHRQVSMKNQAFPGPALPNDGIDGILYSSSSGLFWKNNSAGSPNVQIAGPATVQTNPGSVFLGGLTIKCGSFVCNANGLTIVPFQAGGFGTTLLAVTIGPQFAVATNAVVNIEALSLAGFTVRNFALITCNVSYIAIGF